MKFNICLANVYAPRPLGDTFLHMSNLTDMVRFLELALRDAGAEVTINAMSALPDAINIFFDRFFDVSRRPWDELRAAGLRYALICTEPLEAEGQLNPYDFDPAASRMIYDHFAETARHAEFVWYMFQTSASICRKLNPNSHFLEFGFIPAYAELGPPADRRPDFDILFTGQPTPRRAQITEQLRANDMLVVNAGQVPDYFRLRMMEKARFTVAIQKSDGHAIFSIARIYQAIMNRLPIIVEYDGAESYLSPYCLAAPPATFVATCADFSRSIDTARHAQAIFDRFGAEKPMRPIMTRLLRDTGLL
jgi:hypothetical protein